MSTTKMNIRFKKFVEVTLLLLLGLVAAEDSSCPGIKSCTCANSIMDCRGQSLTKFPDTISKDIKAIYMNDNDIESLSQIPQEAELQTLVLTHNKIRQLSYDAFDNLDNLKILYLSNNSISTISDDIFEWNPLKLEVLYLDGNQLEFIQHFLFYDLEELTDLYLQNNNITFIHPHAFLQLKNLRNLRLDGNKLHTFNYKWIEKLQANSFTLIRFDDNPWSCDCAMNTSKVWLDKEKRSKWFIDVTTKYPIVCTQPKKYEKRPLTDLTKTELELICDMPKITGISSSATIDAGRDVLLRCVYDKTKFPVPTMSWTAPNNDVYRLNTAGNFDGIEVHQDGSLLIRNLTKIDNGKYTCNATNIKGIFSASTMITVNLKPIPHAGPSTTSTTAPVKTPDSKIVAQTHKGCPDGCQCVSRHVDCAGDGTNPKSMVPAKIPIDAVTISLASNALKRIGRSDFSVFNSLEELRIDSNQISEIAPDAFSALTEVTTLTLSQNELSHIEPETFINMKSLNVLVLDKNKLTKLTDDMFEGLLELQWLYIRHNLLQTISDEAFAPLKKIKFIHLESNQIGVLYRESITALTALPDPKIKKIFVDDNAFTCDCHMKDLRNFVQDANTKKKFPDLFGDGIICSFPPEATDMELSEVDVMICDDAPKDSVYPGVLFGGLILGVVLTIVLIILWRVYGRRSRAKGRSYNYSNLNGNDEAERRGLTDNLGTSGTEAFV